MSSAQQKEQRPAQVRSLLTDRFALWLRRTRQALKTKKATAVPCGDCRACCTSAYFIHIGPDESDTLARIPPQLLFVAPGLPKGHVLLGYDKNGHCPMFINNACSIYAHRPQTCRTYDCRVFPATGLQAGGDKPLISQQAGRWQFTFSTTQDHQQFQALQAAATFLQVHAEQFPLGFLPRHPTQQAVVALKVYDVFLHRINTPEANASPAQTEKVVEAIIRAYTKFETEVG